MKNLNLQPLANKSITAKETTSYANSSFSKKVSKIANVSPFILLLVPVFVVMLVSFSIQTPNQNITENKVEVKAKTNFANITTNILK